MKHPKPPRPALPRRHLLAWLGATPLPWLAGAAASAGAANTAAPRIVASFSILADVARELAPAGTEVTSLVGPDADAHVFEARPADGRRLAQADLVLMNGLNFEGWMERLVKVSGYRGPVVVLSEGVPTRQAGRAVDPHIWQDPALMRRCVTQLATALQQRWPAQAAEIQARQAAYLRRLDDTDARIRTLLAAVPRAQRRVITSHDAFGYFGAAYGIDFIAPQGWNTHSEPSAAAVGRIVRQLQAMGVRAIFVENISDPRLVQRIASEGGARVGGTLYSDALSRPGGPADTYLRLLEHNARTLAEALTPGP